MAQAALPPMRARRWGRIINIVGTAARNPVTTFMAGGIANAGLINFTRALADLGAPDHVLVTAVSPGPTATDGTGPRRAERPGASPIGRMGRPETLRISSPSCIGTSEFHHRITITVDGGASRGVHL